MRRRIKAGVVASVFGMVAAAILGHARGMAQHGGPASGRFDFQVVECFDARYLGDTPGHVGRGGGLGAKPDVALGDPVFEGTSRIGKVTNLRWDRAKESLEVEFEPEMYRLDRDGKPVSRNRITVGLDAWIPLGGATAR
jgi:hypothetical protein